jgi:hypothetical protein
MRARSNFVRENLAADYFEEAVDCLLDAFRGQADASHLSAVEWTNRKLRLCTLLSALAAEAYVNAFLAFALSEDEANELDRKPTAEKFVAGPQRAVGEGPLARGNEPLQSVAALFKRRDQIVHARPRRVPVNEYGLRVDAKLCGRSIVAVADCVLVLNDCLQDTDFMGPIEKMHELGDEIDLEPGMIEAEQDYFFTGGLIHVVAAERETVDAIGRAIQQEPLGPREVVPVDLVAHGREAEDRLWLRPNR